MRTRSAASDSLAAAASFLPRARCSNQKRRREERVTLRSSDSASGNERAGCERVVRDASPVSQSRPRNAKDCRLRCLRRESPLGTCRPPTPTPTPTTSDSRVPFPSWRVGTERSKSQSIRRILESLSICPRLFQRVTMTAISVIISISRTLGRRESRDHHRYLPGYENVCREAVVESLLQVFTLNINF